MITILIMFFGVLGVFLQAISRKSNESEKPLPFVVAQYATMASIIILSGYAQFDSAKQQKKLESAKLKISALSEVTEKTIPTLKNMVEIQNNFLTVKHYLSYERAKKEYPELSKVFNWYSEAAESHLQDLSKAKKAFFTIKEIAFDIIRLNREYDGVFPKEAINWANHTISMEFNDIDKYFDPYAPIGEKPKQSVLEYHEHTVKVFSLMITEINEAATLVKM